MIPDSVYWHCFRKLPGFGQKRLLAVMDLFGSGEEAWEAPVSAFGGANLPKDARAALADTRPTIDPARESEILGNENIRILLPSDTDFPMLLREAGETALLYSKGNFSGWNTPCVSIVGSRRHTAYGKQATERIAEDLVRSGFVIVSGLAYGIDSIAHETTLRAGGETIAVLGDSLDDASIHPKDHLPLARRIEERGTLLSEYPPVTPARPETFPARNRIVAGISLGTVVVEATERSGSLITARLALEANREVFAVPGSIFSHASAGTNALLREGAKIVRNVADILEEFPLPERTEVPFEKTARPTPERLSPDETKILPLLSHEPAPVDEIIMLSHCGASAVSSALTMLEIKGLAKNVGGNNYIRMQNVE